jgi:hypothetical protein
MARKTVERERAYYNGQLVTILKRIRRNCQVRTAHGYVLDDVPVKELDFNVEDDQATLIFEEAE